MKPIVIDTSSVILLQKVGLLDHLIQSYQTIITPSVYTELTQVEYDDSRIFKQLYEKGGLIVRPPSAKKASNSATQNMDISGLGIGERDTIKLFLSGEANFIIIDDGQAARKLYQHGLPFINALLFPKILLISSLLFHSEYEAKTKALKSCGRYADWVVKWAENAGTEELDSFLP